MRGEIKDESDLRSPEEYLKLDAQAILERAASTGTSVRELLDSRHPLQESMPLIFEGDTQRDEYFQKRLDKRASLVEAIQKLESEPGFSGPKTDWSGEKVLQIDQLDPAEKAAFYANLDSLNQAYLGKVIATLL